MIRTTANPGRLQHDAHRQPLRAFDVILDLLPRWQAGPQDELLVRGQELPIEKVLETPAVDLEQLGSWDEVEGGAQRLRRHRLHANHD